MFLFSFYHLCLFLPLLFCFPQFYNFLFRQFLPWFFVFGLGLIVVISKVKHESAILHLFCLLLTTLPICNNLFPRVALNLKNFFLFFCLDCRSLNLLLRCCVSLLKHLHPSIVFFFSCLFGFQELYIRLRRVKPFDLRVLLFLSRVSFDCWLC